MELLSDHMAIDPNMNMGTQDTDELELPVVETQPLQILIETSGSWDINANSPETSTSAHGGSAKRFGFRCGEEFSCKVLIKTEFYVVYLNERLLTNSEHMVPVNSIHGLIIDGDSDIWNIAFGNPATIENFKIKDPPKFEPSNSPTEECQSNHEDVFIIANNVNKASMDKIKAVKSTSNLYEPDFKEEESCRELFALSEKTRKSSYQLVFDLDEEEVGDKERRDDDLNDDIRMCPINNAKSKSIQNLFPISLGKFARRYQPASKPNGYHVHDSMEEGELWSIDFDTMANGLPKDDEVDQLCSFDNKMEPEFGVDSRRDPIPPSAMARNGEPVKRSSILCPLTNSNDKIQKILENARPSTIHEICSGDKAIPEESKTPSSGIPRLDVKYFQSLNHLDADTCKKVLHTNTVKLLRSGRSLGSGNSPAGPKQFERSFSLPVRSKTAEHKPLRSGYSKIPKPVEQPNFPTSPVESQPQKMTNGHSNGKPNSTGAVIPATSLTKFHNNSQNLQPKLNGKRLSITSLPPINSPSLKKGQSPPPIPPIKPGTNSKKTSPTPSEIVYRSGTRQLRPSRVAIEKDVKPSSGVKSSVQADNCFKVKEHTVPVSDSIETAKPMAPFVSSPVSESVVPNSLPKPSPMTETTVPSQLQSNENLRNNTQTLAVVPPIEDQKDKPNGEMPDNVIIWGSVKPRESVNNHFSHPISNKIPNLVQTNGTALETTQTINHSSHLNGSTPSMNDHVPKTNGFDLQDIPSIDGLIKESISSQNSQSNLCEPNSTPSTTMNSSTYSYELLDRSNTSPTNDIRHDPTDPNKNEATSLQKSTVSLQLTTMKKDKNSKNFLQSPRKWLSRKLSMVKKSS